MIIAIIPAKKDSNRMPDKNMRVLLGRPLLEYAIDYAKQSRRISRIYVSTDDMAIADFAESQGVKVVSRPEILGGETPLLDVYRHALNTMKLKAVETVAGVQADHPDRNISLDVALDKYEDEGFDCLYSKDANGHKNGAHSIMSAEGILNEKFEKTGFIVDDCTNVHYESDLMIAERKLISRDRH
tara:strand:- start:791 stop:1345 length:555 start_codon:yes stop_codon:yes gene_type:complete